MTPEEQIGKVFYNFDKDKSVTIKDCIYEILSIKVPKKVAECPECEGNGYTAEHDPISCNCHTVSNSCPVQVQCLNCQGTGSITQEFTIKELIEGDYLK